MMKKNIEIPHEVWERLSEGKCVEGSLRRDGWAGKITFRAYNRQARQREKDRMVKKLPWGWVRESLERIKVFGSFPKNVGTAATMHLLDDHVKEAKNALIDRELDVIEFC